jgi:soluble lytic murein transglycosylase-like protein
MPGITRIACAAHLLAAVFSFSVAFDADAASGLGVRDDAPAAVEPVDENERWYDDQAISPPPGEHDPTTDENSESGIDIGDQDVVETGRANRADLPAVLKPADAALYREIFALQDKAHWKEADKKIAKLSDRMLLGHVYFQRYMHPAYRASYKELSGWMSAYRDHPGADRVYHLALRRRPKGARQPTPPEHEASAVHRPSQDAYDDRPSFHALSAASQRYVRQIQRKVRIYVHRGEPSKALRLINTPKAQRTFDTVSMDESRAHIASGYFHAGEDRKALDLGGPAAERSGKYIPASYWWAGLAAWRIGNYGKAAKLFGAMAESDLKSEWTTAAAAFWAARAYLVDGQPEQVNHNLKLASRHPRTFYGLLAIRALGIEPPFEWDRPEMDQRAWDALKREPKVRRAIALIQVDESESAERELKSIAGTLSTEAARALANVAIEYNLPSLALRAGRILSESANEQYDLALFPIPDWEPRNGFTIDKALVFAVMRQESNFRTRAKSHAGARGLMQLMPKTASFVAGKRFRGSHREQLFDPEVNMSLGQKYMEHLLDDPSINGDLFYTVAAYNGGPGNLRKWRRRTDYQDDPLLFIESIPLFETRDYVERVLTNLWIYRYRLGQPVPSLDAIAAGEWPTYTPLDNLPTAQASVKAAGL